jgi:hypothetical protein
MMHSTRDLTGKQALRELIARTTTGRNYIKFGDLSVEIDQTLMSGALWTSSSNGLLNFVINSYMCALTRVGPRVSDMLDYVQHDFRALFEGDDGIVEDHQVPAALITEMGLALKLEPHPDCSTAGFCSLYFDTDENVLVRNPIDYLRKFPSICAKYDSMSDRKRMSLYKCKALSGLDTLYACPVIGLYLSSVEHATRSYSCDAVRHTLEQHDRDVLARALSRRTTYVNPSIKSRLLVERLFGVSVETQLCLEQQIRDQFGRSTIVLDLSTFLTHDDRWYSERFYTADKTTWETPPLRYPNALIEGIKTAGRHGRPKPRPAYDRGRTRFEPLVLEGR